MTTDTDTTQQVPAQQKVEITAAGEARKFEAGGRSVTFVPLSIKHRNQAIDRSAPDPHPRKSWGWDTAHASVSSTNVAHGADDKLARLGIGAVRALPATSAFYPIPDTLSSLKTAAPYAAVAST